VIAETPLASGREADVFALDDKRVLRRYRRETDTRSEAEAMAYVGGLGYPVPEVHSAHGNEMVLERLDGKTMVEAFGSGELTVEDGAAILAGLLGRLHELPPWPAGQEIGHWSGPLPGVQPVTVLHLDLHPENVMMTSRGPVVIDWCNARLGEGDLDTGVSALIMASVAIDGTHPAARLSGTFVDALLPLLPGDPTRLLEQVVAYRTDNPTLTAGELAAMATAAAWVRDGHR
jgi:aminoglycoside phosphotransferase (APT) family kinase protein